MKVKNKTLKSANEAPYSRRRSLTGLNTYSTAGANEATPTAANPAQRTAIVWRKPTAMRVPRGIASRSGIPMSRIKNPIQLIVLEGALSIGVIEDERAYLRRRVTKKRNQAGTPRLATRRPC